ncbi:influenza virus NS1A-binding protein homolog A-like isoform X2 [Zootermopsis nevadensis]|nr:influenza virus NS1A-binding protein homolog A-like isoform X2 [Zootermopsis nevadensis]XP_021924545.1 influenza virus NS1A-binding protein homolog A-like isoform X2 [Zootermopsis nevadensis]XP_021924546.1 influenza virus NS1A-binding protein homolog A-like isoform X2 [Zootermopsis nevadensis]XP_021924547.1 influenza virus NS1A-binding protein homolog A-like isoform X2 [Zootermopsis nevadensis]XP_021924548.1 influenza virus NS1A-binding protein homolog A-like isoform X2 [Zootermopsis nevaden
MVEQLQQNGQAQVASVTGLVFEDDEHNTRTLQSLNMMRKNRHFCDVILHVGSMEFHAHRAVLACASPYLFELFTTDDENKGSQRENVITYKLNGGFDPTALEKLIHYAYTARLEVNNSRVKAVYLAACHLKMDRVMKECTRHLIKNLNIENCIETRSLPGIARNKAFVDQVDAFIAKEFESVSKSKILLSLPCVRIEVLNQTRQEMSLVVGESLCQLVLDWVRRQCDDAINMDQLTEKTHLLYLAMDNSLQDCTELPSGDVSDTEIVQDYKKLSKRNQANPKGRRKGQLQPAKPRVLIYSRDIGERTEQEKETDWNLIAAAKVGEHTFMALVTISGRLATMSVMLRLNQPSSPSPVVTPVASRPASEEKPDLYCVMANMSSVKCAAGCANLNDSLLVCGGYDRAECLKCVELYDPETNLWDTLSSMKEARGRFDIAVVKGKVYAIGGSNGTTELATVEKYDPQEKKWTQITPLPLARCNIGVCDLNDLIYCIGGWNGQVGIKQCDVLDPVTRQWSPVAPLQTGRYQAGVCSMDGLVFAAGGCDAWNCLSSVEVYDPHTDVWTYAKGMITARRGCGLAVFKGRLYAVGGSDGTHSLCSTEIYDPQEKIWTPGPNMTTARANVGVAVIGSRLYAVGGFSGKTFLNSIEYLDEKTNEWTTFVPKLVAEERVGTVCLDIKQEIGIRLQSVDLQPEEENETVHVVGNGRVSHKDTSPVEETVLPWRKRSQNNSRDACQQKSNDGGY